MTDKPDYDPNETAIITGFRFEHGVSYDIPVTRPDESIVTGDGTGTPGWDTVTADSVGNFTYSYQLNGLTGPYVVEVHPSPWAGPGSSGTPLATATFTDMTGEMVIDDLGSGFSMYNLWGQVWGAGYNGHYYWVQNATYSDEAYGIWRPSIPQTRYYAVVAYIPPNHAYTHSARYNVVHESGTFTAVVNQQPLTGFVYEYPPAGSKLGIFRLPAGTSSYVRLGDATGEPYLSTEIGFDAMLFYPTCVYRTEDELRNDTQPECRGTFVYDPGVGNYMSRAQLLANASYFLSKGWSMNFLWYAPETTKSISTADPVQWSACPWGAAPHPGSVCPSSGLNWGRVTSSVPYGFTNGLFAQNADIHAWTYGDAFIGRVCANFSQSKTTPVPRISGFKWEDLNGDGVWQKPNEPPLQDWEIILRDPNGIDHSTLTNPDGSYTFPIYYPPGTYTLRETLKPGWVNTKSPGPVSVNEGVGDKEHSGNNFGNRPWTPTPTDTPVPTPTDTPVATPTDTPIPTPTDTPVPTPTDTPVPTPTDTPVPTPTDTPIPTPTDTPVPTPTDTPVATPTDTPVPPTVTPTPTPAAVEMDKDVDPTTPGVDSLANLWLCQGTTCTLNGEGELVIAERLSNANDPDGLGAYEFQLKFDHKIFDIVIEDAGFLGSTGRTVDCTMTIITENDIRFGCLSSGPMPGPTGSGVLALIHVTPEADLKYRLTPGQENGLVRTLLDENCELTDVYGDPLADSQGNLLPGILSGGLVAVCTDATITVRILEADLNLDCGVDIIDDQMIAFRYGAGFGNALYEPWYDLEPALKDYDIDIKDIQKVFGRNGSTCQAPIPEQIPLPPPGP